MIYRLYDEETNTHFRMEWFLMEYMVVKTGQVFNWVNILAFNIFNRAKEATGMKNHGFYMLAYLIDAIFSVHHFPTFEWSWTPSQPPIHIYCSELWDVNYKEYFYNICDYFLAPLYKVILGIYPHRISQGAIKTLREIGDWYVKNIILISGCMEVLECHISYPSMFLTSC
jgi:hypothetical protein